jgi:hypothetical protein
LAPVAAYFAWSAGRMAARAGSTNVNVPLDV